MSTKKFPVSAFMTPIPHPVQVTDSLSMAQRRMHTLGVHHLPVLSELDIVGVLSDRDVRLAQALGIDLEGVPVGLAMTAGPYVVEPEMSISEVARTMANRRVGSAIVMGAQKLLGILTTVDVLLCLAALAEGRSPTINSGLPSAIRRRIRAEHAELRRVLDEMRACANRALAQEDEGEVGSADVELRTRAQDFYRTLLRHLALEDTVLAPALSEAPTYGVLRATKLLEKHQGQREQLLMASALSSSSNLDQLARSMLALVDAVREDLRDEEAWFLSPQALDDDVVASDFVGD